jgi:ParB-like chromosome segregation protein Spo0J
MPTNLLTLDPKNTKDHPPDSIKAIKASLVEYGQRRPIVVQETNDGYIVRAGNGTLMATQALNRKFIAVVKVKENDKRATGFAIADNRSAEKSKWNIENLSNSIRDLIGDKPIIDSIGFDIGAIDKLLQGQQEKKEKRKINYKMIFEVVVSCDSEDEQQAVFEKLTDDGLKCRVLSM